MKWVLFILVMGHATAVYTQRSEQWLQQHDLGAFHEGAYTREVSTASMELISLIAFWEPYEYGQRQNLKVRFYSPEASDYFIKAEELTVKKYYWMQNKPRQAQCEWNEFSGWQVDRWLSKLQLPASSLGVVVQIGPKEMRQFLPAWVYHTENRTVATRYIAQMRLGVNIEKGDYQLYRGKERKPANLIKQGNILGQYGGSCIPLVFQTSDLPGDGWYFVVVNVIEKISKEPFGYSFQFFHRQ